MQHEYVSIITKISNLKRYGIFLVPTSKAYYNIYTHVRMQHASSPSNLSVRRRNILVINTDICFDITEVSFEWKHSNITKKHWKTHIRKKNTSKTFFRIISIFDFTFFGKFVFLFFLTNSNITKRVTKNANMKKHSKMNKSEEKYAEKLFWCSKSRFWFFEETCESETRSEIPTHPNFAKTT